MPDDFIFELAGGRRVIFTSPAGESTWHVALKLLAYLLYRHRAPLVEHAVGQRFKPDLVLERAGRVRLWIDCGDTSLRKLDRVLAANPAALVVIVKDTPRRLDSYIELAAAVRDSRRIRYLAFSDGLVQDLARALLQRNRVGFSCSPEGLRVELNGKAYNGTLYSRGTPVISPHRSGRRRAR